MTDRPRASRAPSMTDLMSEDDWQDWVIGLALRTGWMVTHSVPAWSGDGKRMRTATQGHTGFPDLVLARAGVVLIVELKTNTGRLSAEQRAWLAALGSTGAVWRPRDRDHVQAVLTAPAGRSRSGPTGA